MSVQKNQAPNDPMAVWHYPGGFGPLKGQNACPTCAYEHPYWSFQEWVSKNPGPITCYSCCNIFMLGGNESMVDPKPTTQKARGVRALLKHQWGNMIVPQVTFLKKVAEEWSEELLKAVFDFPYKGAQKLFARPCPPNPEHGFVESRVVNSVEELLQVKKETFEADPDSEVLIMPVIDAKWNQIWTPALLVIGQGNDGATAGKNTLSIPLCGKDPLPHSLITLAGIIKPVKGPYIEAVTEPVNPNGVYGNDYQKTWITQLRGGPPLESGVELDFIPFDLTVKQVIKTNGEDLLEWAKVIRAIKGATDVIVYHPGGALTDHYSVHCRENDIPLAITFEPVEGLVLEAASFKQVAKLDPHQMALGLAVGDHATLKHAGFGSWVRLALTALHHSSVMRGPHSFWLGVAAASLMKLGCAAMEGEARHAHSCFKGMKAKPDIYNFYTSKSVSFLRARLSRITQLLYYGFGVEKEKMKGSGGYGGIKWALCGSGMLPLFNAMREVVLNESEQGASDLVMGLNIAINQAHNGGWWLNKFIDIGAYDRAVKCEPDVSIMATPAFWYASELRPKAEDLLLKTKKRVAAWPAESTISPLKWRKISLDIGPGSFVLNLKAATLPTPRMISLGTTPELITSLLSNKGELKISPGEISLKTEGGVDLSLWKEIPLEVKARNVGKGY